MLDEQHPAKYEAGPSRNKRPGDDQHSPCAAVARSLAMLAAMHHASPIIWEQQEMESAAAVGLRLDPATAPSLLIRQEVTEQERKCWRRLRDQLTNEVSIALTVT